MATPASPLATIERDIKWVQGHILVALLAIGLIIGSIIGGVALFEGMQEKHDARLAAAASAQSQAATATQAAVLSQLQQDRAANAVRDAANTALIQSLVSQMAQQRAATAKQLKTDSTLDANAAAARLSAQTKAAPGDVTVSNDTVSMTLPLTRVVVGSLDQLAQSQNDVTNLEGQLDSQKILTSDAKVELTDANKVIAADEVRLITRIDADNAACQARIDQQASKDRKRGFWATVVSFAGGLVVRGLI